jgi:hypothetical protein
MKKIFLIVSLLFTFAYVNAQTNVQLHYDFGKDRSLTSTVLTEPVLWYNINKSLSVGSEVEISSNIDFVGMKVFPTLAIKYTL